MIEANWRGREQFKWGITKRRVDEEEGTREVIRHGRYPLREKNMSLEMLSLSLSLLIDYHSVH